MNEKERIDLIDKIVTRAADMGIGTGYRVTQFMDMRNADKQFSLRLTDMLNASPLDFTHDYVGIQQHMNRLTGRIEDLFLPRFSQHVKQAGIAERVKMVKAMEYIARHLNDEELFVRSWLTLGVADGDIEYGDLCAEDPDGNVDCYTDDEEFSGLMHLFLRLMKAAAKSGGLYCDGVLDAGTRNERNQE